MKKMEKAILMFLILLIVVYDGVLAHNHMNDFVIFNYLLTLLIFFNDDLRQEILMFFSIHE
jgi:hypothetical protein